MNNLRLGKLMLKLYTLASIIEAEVYDGRYDYTENKKLIKAMNDLKRRCERLRKNFDSYYKEHSEHIGNFTDELSAILDKHIKVDLHQIYIISVIMMHVGDKLDIYKNFSDLNTIADIEGIILKSKSFKDHFHKFNKVKVSANVCRIDDMIDKIIEDTVR